MPGRLVTNIRLMVFGCRRLRGRKVGVASVVSESPLNHPIEGTIFARKRSVQSRLIDDLDDATRPRINQHGLVIHNRISVIGRSVLVGNIIVGNARTRQNYADLNRLSIMK
jgi:hypothetical protein